MKKRKRKNNLNNYDALENVASFEEARAIIKARLNHLNSDLMDHSETEENLFNEICKAYEDRKIDFMDLYACYFAPCKVSDPVFLPAGQGDMNDVMIDFSEGFNEFISSMEDQYIICFIKRRRATTLFSKMLSVKLPYSRLMYLYYYKKLDPDEISDSLYISRSTFYRLKSAAINALTKLYYPPKGKEPDNPGKGGKVR